jgi:hypothetical protein
MPQWTPILEPLSPLYDRALAAVDRITQGVLAEDPVAAPAARNLTSALLLTYRWLGDGDAQWISPAITRLNVAIARADGLHSTLRFGLLEGLAGLGWVVEHVARRLGGESKETPLNGDIDAALLQELQRGRWQHGWDLANGLTGLGIYFLERLPAAAARQGLSLVAGHLEEVFRRRDLEREDPRRLAELAYFLGQIGTPNALLERVSTFLVTAAWPEGELDIAAMCLQTGIRTGLEDLGAIARQQIKLALRRHPEARLAFTWNLVWHLHPDTRCREAALQAIKELLDWREREGGAGNGLVLLAAVTAVEPEWSRLSLWP